jgi:hypothetical protein
MIDCLPWALEYASRGLVVLPLLPGQKEARERGRYCDCTGADTVPLIGSSDPEWIRARWQRQPNSNLGIVCGGRSGLLALDLDVKRDGGGDLARWEHDRKEEGKVLPSTVSYVTATGGRHIWYQLPPGQHFRRNDYWLRGVEIKACGGYVAVPPTTRAIVVETLVDGFVVSDEDYRTYTWAETNGTGLAVAPDWFLEDISKRVDGIGRSRAGGVKRTKTGDVRIELPPDEEFIEKGLGWFYRSRNEDAYHLAWRALRRKGTAEIGLVTELLRRCWNATADKSDSSWHEIEQTVQSALRRIDHQDAPLREFRERYRRERGLRA